MQNTTPINDIANIAVSIRVSMGIYLVFILDDNVVSSFSSSSSVEEGLLMSLLFVGELPSCGL